ncbi:S-adenosyl-L-methionine-dependent methyltransferase [Mycena vulgaris]|nr:S-adenosyl-L-methionine-dependent methyltransferase [Mycena vulgaris]
MVTTINPQAQAGFAKGTNELYNKVRPGYPPQALSHMRRAITSSGPLNVVEIGAGTGLFTRALLAHPEWVAVSALRAVEPSAGMREAFAKYTLDARIVLSEGTFDATGVEDGWADLVVVAQAFHWCMDYEAAAAEFARILKPGGVIALIWNLEDSDVAWIRQVRDRVERDEKDAPNWHSGLYFSPPEDKRFRHDVVGTLDRIVGRGLSSSRDVEEIVQRGEGRVWVDESQGTFVYPHTTDLAISKRV